MSDEIRLSGTGQVLIYANDNFLDERTNIIKERKTPSCGLNTGITTENIKDALVSGHKSTVKDKSVPLQASSGPEGSRKLRFPDYVTMAQDGGKIVSLTHRPLLSPGNTPGTDFC